MNVTYEKKDAMTFIGYHTEIRPEEGYQKCPEFWDKEYAAKYARLWQTMKPENAVEKAYKGGEVPGGLELYSFPASEWAVFTTKGPMPASLQTLNTAVWQEWFPNEGQKYHANGNATLEVYSAGNPQSPDYECGIWVPISGRRN